MEDAPPRPYVCLAQAAIPASALGRIGVVAVAVALTDASVATMDEQLRTLVLADFPGALDRFLLSVEYLGHAIRAAPADSPIALMRNNVLRRFG